MVRGTSSRGECGTSIGSEYLLAGTVARPPSRPAAQSSVSADLDVAKVVGALRTVDQPLEHDLRAGWRPANLVDEIRGPGEEQIWFERLQSVEHVLAEERRVAADGARLLDAEDPGSPFTVEKAERPEVSAFCARFVHGPQQLSLQSQKERLTAGKNGRQSIGKGELCAGEQDENDGAHTSTIHTYPARSTP